MRGFGGFAVRGVFAVARLRKFFKAAKC
jgi:hypothetical protein